MLTIGGSPAEIAGEWFPWRLKGVKREEAPELKIRALPPGKQKELLYRYLGRKQKLRQRTVKEDGKRVRVTEHELDNEQTNQLGIAAGCYALVDVRRFTCKAGTEDVAAVFSRALGRTVSPDEEIELDGKLTDEIKTVLFEHRTELLEFVTEKAGNLGRLDIEEETAAGEI